MNSDKKKLKTLRLLGKIVTGGFGTLMGLGIVGGLFSNDIIMAELGTLIIFLPPVLGGYFLYKNTDKRIKIIEQNSIEDIVLNLASANNGKLTVNKLAGNTHFTIDRSKEILDEMVEKGTVQVEVNNEAVVEYYFRGLY
ncbi:MAG: hypothetical protein WC313_01705 [Candidatus Kapaibacterium sp.]